METEKKAIIFNSIGLLASLYILVSGPIFVIENLTFILVQVFGLLLIGWAIIAKLVNKHDSDKLPEGYFFVTKGPYEIIRHPIYAGFLLIMSSFVQYNFVFLRILAFFVLIAVIILKVIREEDTMRKEIKTYEDYMSKTKRLIPLLF